MEGNWEGATGNERIEVEEGGRGGKKETEWGAMGSMEFIDLYDGMPGLT